MQPGMLRCRHDLKHLNAVIRLISEMVDNFIWSQEPAEMALHHKAMFKDMIVPASGGMIRRVDFDVSHRRYDSPTTPVGMVLSAPPHPFADNRTETRTSAFDIRRNSQEIHSAMFAGSGDGTLVGHRTHLRCHAGAVTSSARFPYVDANLTTRGAVSHPKY